jgi:exosortase
MHAGEDPSLAAASAGSSIDLALLSQGARWRMAILAALLVLAYANVIRHQLIERWLNDANWSHGWLIPMFSAYFLVTRRELLLRARIAPSAWGAVLLSLSLVLYFVSAWRLKMAYPQAVSMVGAIAGTTLLLGGWGVMRVAWFPILFLLLAIPLPSTLYVELTMPLRKLASQVAAAVLPFFAPGLHTEAQAVVIDYIMPGAPAGQLNVEEACSGMRSIMAFVTLGIAVAYLHERPWWQRVVLLVSCIPIALVCNSIRVTATGLFHIYGYKELAQGSPHTLLGVLMFALALGLFSLLGFALGRLWVEVPEAPIARSLE